MQNKRGNKKEQVSLVFLCILYYSDSRRKGMDFKNLMC